MVPGLNLVDHLTEAISYAQSKLQNVESKILEKHTTGDIVTQKDPQLRENAKGILKDWLKKHDLFNEDIFNNLDVKSESYECKERQQKQGALNLCYRLGAVFRNNLAEEYIDTCDPQRKLEIKTDIGAWLTAIGFGSHTEGYFRSLDLTIRDIKNQSFRR